MAIVLVRLKFQYEELANSNSMHLKNLETSKKSLGLLQNKFSEKVAELDNVKNNFKNYKDDLKTKIINITQNVIKLYFIFFNKLFFI